MKAPIVAWFLCVFTCVALRAEMPAGGQPLLAPDALFSHFNPGQEDGKIIARAEKVAVEHPAFDEALRVEVINATGKFYNGGVHMKVTEPVGKGDLLLAHFYFRSIENAEETGLGFATIFAQGPGPEYEKFIVREVTAGSEWRELFVPFRVTSALPAGKFSLNIGAGGGANHQTWELGGLELVNYGADLEIDDLPQTRASYEGRAADAPWRAEAQARIEKYRKGGFVVKVVDASGQPVPGAHVEVRMREHAYQFGTAVSVSKLMGEGADTERYREVLQELFNQAGPENALKWPSWSGDWGGKYSKEKTLTALKWLRENGIYVRGHVLVWPSKRHMPRDMHQYLPSDLTQADPAAKQIALDHIEEITTKTAAYVQEWDVVNEPYNNHDMMDAFGAEVMIDWFKAAHEVVPEKGLFLNDYAILSSRGRDILHQQHYEETLRLLVDGGAPITGMGMQGHFGETPTDIPRVFEILEHYHGEFPKLDIRVTEFDFDTHDQQLQADYTRDFMTILFSHPATVGVQCWGFWEGAHWRANAAMYTRDWQPKPNAEAWRKLIKETWWTHLEGATNADGAFQGRGFYGKYDVWVTFDGKRMSSWALELAPGSENEWVLRRGID